MTTNPFLEMEGAWPPCTRPEQRRSSGQVANLPITKHRARWKWTAFAFALVLATSNAVAQTSPASSASATNDTRAMSDKAGAVFATAKANGPPPPPQGARKELVAGGVVAAGAALGMGILFVALGVAKAGEANAKGGWDRCYQPGAADLGCPVLNGLRSDAATFSNIGFWSLAVSVALGGGTLAYAFLAPRQAGGQGAALVPVVTGQGGGLAMVGRW